MIPAANQIYYFVRDTSTLRFNKRETMALSFLDQTEDGHMRFNRLDWTQLTIAKSKFLNPDFMLSMSVIGGPACTGVEIVKSLPDLNDGVFSFHETKFTLVDKATHAEHRKYIIDTALSADLEQNIGEVAA